MMALWSWKTAGPVKQLIKKSREETAVEDKQQAEAREALLKILDSIDGNSDASLTT